MKDKELIRRIQKGEKQYFSELISRYYDDIYRFCYYKTGNSNVSYDLTQEVFFKLIKYINSYKEEHKFKSYLYHIALNICYDYFSKKESEWTQIQGDIIENRNRNKEIEDKVMIEKLLNKLPEKQKDVILLRYYQEMKFKEIAEITGEKIATVKSRLRQGIEKMNQLLEKEDIHEA